MKISKVTLKIKGWFFFDIIAQDNPGTSTFEWFYEILSIDWDNRRWSMEFFFFMEKKLGNFWKGDKLEKIDDRFFGV